MSAYAAFIREKTLDAAELETYMKEVGATVKGQPIEVLAADGPHCGAGGR